MTVTDTPIFIKLTLATHRNNTHSSNAPIILISFLLPYYTGWFKKIDSNSKRRLNTRQTVGCGVPSSLLALRVDLRVLLSKLSWIRLTFSSDTRGRPELLALHRQPICSNWLFQRQMLFLVGGWMLKRRRNARCTAVADSVLMNSRTQKILRCIVAILFSTDAAARLCVRQAL